MEKAVPCLSVQHSSLSSITSSSPFRFPHPSIHPKGPPSPYLWSHPLGWAKRQVWAGLLTTRPQCVGSQRVYERCRHFFKALHLCHKSPINRIRHFHRSPLEDLLFAKKEERKLFMFHRSNCLQIPKD